MSESFVVRLAAPADAHTIAWHRARMFRDMGDVPPNLFEAELLLRQIIEWAQAERLDRIILHASDEARSLYERLGFRREQREMRLALDSAP